MHVSEAFLVLRRPHHDIFLNLSPVERAEARATIIHMVLATDMSQHFRNLAELRAQIDAHRAKAQEFSVNNPADRLLCLETALHCADLANPCKPLPIYVEWTRRIYDEFYAQGDEERRRGLPISAMCDRYRPSVERSQIGFIDCQ
jgi:cAMP-specific phosphodiesterase 4